MSTHKPIDLAVQVATLKERVDAGQSATRESLEAGYRRFENTDKRIDAVESAVLRKIEAIEVAIRPVPWWKQGPLVTLVALAVTWGVAIVRLPTRDDLEKVVTALVNRNMELDQKSRELERRVDRMSASVDQLAEQVKALRQDLDQLRRDTAAAKRRFP